MVYSENEPAIKTSAKANMNIRVLLRFVFPHLVSFAKRTKYIKEGQITLVICNQSGEFLI